MSTMMMQRQSRTRTGAASGRAGRHLGAARVTRVIVVVMVIVTGWIGGGGIFRQPRRAAAAENGAAISGVGGQGGGVAAAVGGSTLTLAEALALARANQPTLEQAEGARVAADAGADLARAPLLPQLNASGTYSRATANFVAPAGSLPSGLGGRASVSSFDNYPFWRFGVSASQLIWDFGQTPNRWRAAKAGAEAQAQSYHVTAAQVDFNVRIAFFTARAARELVGVAKDTLANLEKHLAQIEGFVELGTHPAIDLSQARADRANGRVQLINAENGYDVARAQLNLAMGVERSVDYQLSDDGLTPVDGEDAEVEKLVDEAARARPELGNLRLLVTSQELQVRSAREGYLPSLGLAANFSDNGAALDQLTWNASGLLVLSVPIFLGGQVDAQVRQNRGLLTQARAQLELEHQQVRLDVEQGRLGVRAAKAAISAAADALANTTDRLRLAEGRYQTGVGSIIELGDAQVAETAAAAQRVQAEYQLYTARAQLLRALGRS
jgi:outer membrane protein